MSEINKLIYQYCPNGVEYLRLEDNVEIRRGERVTKRDISSEGEYPVISGGVSPLGYMPKTNRTKNTITIASYGSAGYVDLQKKDFWANDVCLCLYPNEKLLNKFLYYILKFNQNYLYSKTTKAIPDHIPTKIIKDLMIPIPPIEVQNKIVDILDSFTTLEAELEAELEARKKQYAYYKEQILSFDDTVEKKQLSSLCKATSNIKWNKTNGVEYQYIDLTSVDIQTRTIQNTASIDMDTAPSRAQQIVETDDILFATTRPTQMRVCAIPAKYNGAICSTGYCVLRPNKSVILPRFLMYSLSLNSFKKYLENNQTRGNYPAISNNTLKQYSISVPSIEKQMEITELLDKFEALTNSLVSGLPAEIAARHKQYEYYRDKLLTFKRKEA